MHYIALHCSLFQYITLCCFMRCGLTSARPFSDSKKFRETFQFYQLGLINCQTSKSRLQKPKVLTRTDLFFFPIFLQKKYFTLPFVCCIGCITDIFLWRLLWSISPDKPCFVGFTFQDLTRSSHLWNSIQAWHIKTLIDSFDKSYRFFVWVLTQAICRISIMSGLLLPLLLF